MKKKPRIYSINAEVTGSKWLGNYAANSAEEAIGKAMYAHGYISLCHQCASQCEDAEITDVSAELTDAPEEEPKD